MVKVSAIITTIGSDFVKEAIKSVKNQSYKNIEVIVCYDGDNFKEFKKLLDQNFNDLILLNVGPFNNANNARQAGIIYAKGKYIALLDDDDYWHETHIEKHVIEAEKIGLDNLVLISNSILILGKKEVKILPERYFNGRKESVAEYLFCLKNKQKTLMQTSSFFFSKSVGLNYPFDTDLTLHQDYDWIIRIDESNQVFIKQTGFNTSYYVIDTNVNSISKKSKAENSIQWASKVLSNYPKFVTVDFLKNNTLWMLRNSSIFSIISNLLSIKKKFNLSFYESLPLFHKILILKIKIKIKKIFKLSK